VTVRQLATQWMAHGNPAWRTRLYYRFRGGLMTSRAEYSDDVEGAAELMLGMRVLFEEWRRAAAAIASVYGADS
jgi:hypothetical protein